MSNLPQYQSQNGGIGMIKMICVLISIFSSGYLHAQNVGVNTVTPKAGLDVQSNNGILSTGTFGLGSVQDSGYSTRLMWIPLKGALRAGRLFHIDNLLYEDYWNPANIGDYSVATGLNSKASGFNSFSHGEANEAVNNNTVSLGGTGNIASGRNSFASGLYTTSLSANEFVIGSYPTIYTPLNPNLFDPGDRVFNVGIGESNVLRKDAFTILKNGSIGIGTNTPMSKLHLAGNMTVDNGRISFINNGKSVMIGQDAGLSDDHSDNVSVFIGYEAGRANINGNNNIAIGSRAFDESVESHYNIALGEDVMGSSTMSGNVNIGIGNFSLQNLSSGENNVAIGQNTLGQATTSENNVAIGNYAADAITSGDYNVAVGSEALGSVTGSSENVAIGHMSLQNASGDANTAVGAYTGVFAGSGNVFLGNRAGFTETGDNKLYISNNPSSSPLIKGDFSSGIVTINNTLETTYFKMTNGAGTSKVLQSDASGNASWTNASSLFTNYWSGTGTDIYNNNGSNVGIGTNTPLAKLHVAGSMIIDNGRLTFSNINNSIYIGDQSGGSFTGSGNVGIGFESMKMTTTGSSNAAYGVWSMRSNTTGADNVAFGISAMKNHQTGDKNVAIGALALSLGTTGNGNVMLGNSAGSLTSGDNNTMLGFESGLTNSGSGNVFVGKQSGAFYNGSNKLIIDNSSTSTPLLYGDFANNKLVVNDSLTSTYFQMTNGAGENKLLQSNASGHASWIDPSAVFSDDWITNGNNISNTNTNNVGIGTNAPEEKLHVAGNTRIEGRIIVDNTGQSVFVGAGAGSDDDHTNNRCVMIGYDAGRYQLLGERNIGIGAGSLYYNQVSSDNIAIGNNTMSAPGLQGNQNIGLGNFSLEKVNTGMNNAAVGHRSLGEVTQGVNNIAMGIFSADALTQGSDNVALGYDALGTTTSGSYNVIIGSEAGRNTINFNNVYIGRRTGFSTNGANNVFIGNKAGQDLATANDRLIIANSETSTPLISGDFFKKSLTINDSLTSKYFRMTNGAGANKVMQSNASGYGSWVDPATLFTNHWTISGNDIYNNNSSKVGIGTISPAEKLHVNGNLRVDGRIPVTNTGNSVFIGEDAGVNDDLSDNRSVLLGYKAGASQVSSERNIGIGAQALTHNFSGSNNIAIGDQAMGGTSMGGHVNIGIGNFSLYNLANGTENTTIGQSSLGAVTSGNYNIAMGNYAGDAITSGEYNVALGYESLGTTTTGNFNVAIGGEAGRNGAGSQNVFVGRRSGFYTNGTGNVFIGHATGENVVNSDNALIIDNSNTTTPLIQGNFITNKVTINDSLTSKYFQMTNGAGANKLLQSNAAGHGNWVDATSIFSDDWTTSGNNIFNANTNNVGIGTSSPTQKLHITGNLRVEDGRIDVVNQSASTLIGFMAGINEDVTSNRYNTFIGNLSGKSNITGTWNVALGYTSLTKSTIGNFNVAIGNNSLFNNTSGSENIAIGLAALFENLSGINNVAVGNGALKNALQNNNVGLGHNAGYSNTNGTQNVFLGNSAGSNNSGSGNIFLGYTAGQNIAGDNKLVIDNSDTSTPLIYGDFTNNHLTINDSLTVDRLRIDGGRINFINTGLSVFIGEHAGKADDLSSNRNVFVGDAAGQKNTTGDQNVAVGAGAFNTATTSSNNVAIGRSALASVTTGGTNTSVGSFSGDIITTGTGNTALGYESLGSISTSSHNTSIGALSLMSGTGADNTALGFEAGSSATGSSNVYIGYRAGRLATGNSKLYIDNSDTSTPLIFGDFTSNKVTINDSLSVTKELTVNIASTTSTFEVNGSVATKIKPQLVAGTTNPDDTGMIWRYTSGTGTITLPGASTCPNRIYVIINHTGALRNISTYRDLTNTNQMTTGNNTGLWIISDGTEWLQIK